MKNGARVAMAAVAVAVMAGAAWAVYDMVDGDDGSMVMIKADNAAYKVKPDEAGGMEIPHQDKMVFNAGSEGQTVQVEQIMPPPEQPLMASEPVDAPPPVQPASAPVPPEMEKKDATMALGRVVLPESPVPSQVPAVKPTAEATAAFDMGKTDQPSKAVAQMAPAPEAAPAPAAASAPPPATANSPVNQEQIAPPEKESVKTEEPKAPSQPAAAPSMAMEPVGKLAAGAPRFQLASFFDRASAEKAVPQLAKKYSASLQGSELAIVEATIKGKGRVYRVQGTANSPSGVCGNVKAEGGTCVIVRP